MSARHPGPALRRRQPATSSGRRDHRVWHYPADVVWRHVADGTQRCPPGAAEAVRCFARFVPGEWPL